MVGYTETLPEGIVTLLARFAPRDSPEGTFTARFAYPFLRIAS
jgi:hypothetical protein